MSKTKNDLLAFCQENSVCEFCFKRECNCYEEYMNNLLSDEYYNIENYLNR